MIIDIINKKRLNFELTKSELKCFFDGYLRGDVLDYQMSSMLMAICINGMSDNEIFNLTDIFIESGDILDFSALDGVCVDKHSTGGVGDKTTLVVVPIVAALGVLVVKMSGRGLGYTGGTIDKLESIDGFNVNLTEEEIIRQVSEIGAVITSQTKELCPLDKKIYALRDVTATTESIALIAVSVMSKKIASGADKILIDVKVGSGAFIKTIKDAEELSALMIKIGNKYNRETRVIISSMDTPLGNTVGNRIEVTEAIDVLKGKYVSGLTDLCIEIASNMVSMGRNISLEESEILVNKSISDGSSYKKFVELINAQGGSLSELALSNKSVEIKSYRNGVIKNISAIEVAKLVSALGAGRKNKDDIILVDVGIRLNVHIGDIVGKNDVLATIYYKNILDEIINVDNIFTFSDSVEVI